jgi:hypothetical protein
MNFLEHLPLELISFLKAAYLWLEYRGQHTCSKQKGSIYWFTLFLLRTRSSDQFQSSVDFVDSV